MPSKMTAPAPAASLPPGFIALHGNRIETLLDTVAGWLAQHPLAKAIRPKRPVSFLYF